MRSRTVVMIVLLLTIGGTMCLPSFAYTANTGHVINVYFPHVSHKNDGNTIVTYKDENYFEPNYDDAPSNAYDTTHILNIITTVDMSADFRYSSETVILYNYGDNDFNDQQALYYECDSPLETVTAVTLGLGRTPIPMELVVDDMYADGSFHKEYRLSMQLGPVQAGHNSIFNLYLWVPAVTSMVQDQIVTDEQLINELLGQVPTSIGTPDAQAWLDVNGLANALPYGVELMVLAITLAVVGYLITARR